MTHALDAKDVAAESHHAVDQQPVEVEDDLQPDQRAAMLERPRRLVDLWARCAIASAETPEQPQRPLVEHAVDGGGEAPRFGPSESLDYELELGIIVGSGNDRGRPIDMAQAEDGWFGVWSSGSFFPMKRASEIGLME